MKRSRSHSNNSGSRSKKAQRAASYQTRRHDNTEAVAQMLMVRMEHARLAAQQTKNVETQLRLYREYAEARSMLMSLKR